MTSDSPSLGPTVAALYVDPRGPYPRLAGVYCWAAPERDAKEYAGPWPVVAHPPCGPWGKLRHLSRHDDPACAPRAVEQVRAFGGVLEHPAGSLLWNECDMPLPWCLPDAYGGYSVEIAQCDWGHVARKTTWLYLVGVPTSRLMWPARREPTHWCSGFRTGGGRVNRYRSKGSAVPPGIKVCSAQQRRRTPPALAEYLVGLARSTSELKKAS
jgi:hypothetical protein